MNEEKPALEPPKKKPIRFTLLKWVSGLLALTSLGFAVASLVLFGQSRKKESESEESYLTLTGKSYSESKSILDQFGKNEPKRSYQRTIKDYAFIGNRLFLSTHKITPELLKNPTGFVPSGFDGYALYNLTSNIAYASLLATDFTHGIYSLDLSKAANGDYLIYPFLSGEESKESKEELYPVSVDSSKAIRMTFYTLPDKKKNRRKIVFKNNARSPYTLVSVSDCGDKLPSAYYDAVLYPRMYKEDLSLRQEKPGEEDLSNLVSSLSALGYKTTYRRDIKEAASVSSTYALALDYDDGKDYLSFYLALSAGAEKKYETKVIASEVLKGYDYYPEIRELSGHIDMAGESYQSVIGNDILSLKDEVAGKESYILSTSQKEASSLLNDFFAERN